MSGLLIIVPARGGSKRLPGKNLKELGGRTLLSHTSQAIEDAGLDAPVILSTDDDRIADEGRRLGWLVPFRRPAELATDEATTINVVLHALNHHLAEGSGADAEMVMVLQPTSPLRGADCLKAAVAMLDSDPDVDSIISMTALHLPPMRIFLTGADGMAVPLDARDKRRPMYVPNGALYLTRTAALRRENTLYAGAIRPLVLDAHRAVDIDTNADLSFAEALLGAPKQPEATSFEAQPAEAGSVA